MSYVSQTFDPVAACPTEYPSMPTGSVSVAERFKLLHQGILGTFSSIQNMLDLPPFSGDGDPTKFNVMPPEKLDSMFDRLNFFMYSFFRSIQHTSVPFYGIDVYLCNRGFASTRRKSYTC